jgi:hypothetical protein
MDIITLGGSPTGKPLRVTSTIYFCAQGSFTEDETGSVAVPKDMPGVEGIFLGGCVDAAQPGRIARSCGVLAHAHIGGHNVNWICFQMPSYFHDPTYHWLRMHELAHVLSGQGHTEKWRTALRGLGEEVPARYRYRPRTSR